MSAKENAASLRLSKASGAGFFSNYRLGRLRCVLLLRVAHWTKTRLLRYLAQGVAQMATAQVNVNARVHPRYHALVPMWQRGVHIFHK